MAEDRSNEERYEAAFEGAFDALLVADDDGRYLDANPSACRLLGVEYDDLIDRRIDEFAPEDYDFEAAWAEFQASGRERDTFPLVRADGERRTVEYAATADIVPGEHLSVLRDVTDRVERTERLERQNERLEAFTAIVSHDLRNPLAVAQGHLELTRETGDVDHLDAAERALDRMARLTEDLLSLAREGHVAGAETEIDLAGAVHEAWSTIDTGPATLAAEAEGVVRADPSRLGQLLENLFANAVQHGGEDVAVTVGDLDGGFSVADDGPGIDPADREAVFEPGHTSGDRGTGLGLAIVRRVARAHGWDVTLTESEAGGLRVEVTSVERPG